MSKSVYSGMFCDSPGRVAVVGSFVATTGDNVGNVFGTGFTVEKTGPGVYNCILTDSYPELLYFSCDLTSSSIGPDPLFLLNTISGSLTNTVGNITINIYALQAGSLSPFNGDGLISICYILKNTGITSK